MSMLSNEELQTLPTAVLDDLAIRVAQARIERNMLSVDRARAANDARRMVSKLVGTMLRLEEAHFSFEQIEEAVNRDVLAPYGIALSASDIARFTILELSAQVPRPKKKPTGMAQSVRMATPTATAVEVAAAGRPAVEPAAVGGTAVRIEAAEKAQAKERETPILVCTTTPTAEHLHPTTADIFNDVPREFFSSAVLAHPGIPGLMLTPEQRRYSSRLTYTADEKPEVETASQVMNRMRWKKPATRTPSRTDEDFAPMNPGIFRPD